MRIAFYAPLKSPEHPVPSGDRRMARGLMAALRHPGHEVRLASELRSWAKAPEDQSAIAAAGTAEAARLIDGFRENAAERPDAWFTYHLYYRAPDWIGPAVAEALAIPYAVAEASFAMKRAEGPWKTGHDQTERALQTAAVIFTMKTGDAPGLKKVRDLKARMVRLPPFLQAFPDPGPADVAAARRDLAGGDDDEVPVLLAVGMMRARAKLASYRHLAVALARIRGRVWRLAIVGDGDARAEVEAAFAGFEPGRVRFLGARPPEDLPALYAAADLLVWPGIGEAYGMIYLEAASVGLPVVATRSAGAANVVAEGVTGRLVPGDDRAAFADAVASLLANPDERRRLGVSARGFVRDERSVGRAATIIDRAIAPLVAGAPPAAAVP